MWTSKTSQFGRAEMSALETMTPETLKRSLTQSDPLVALRALAEIMLNGDDDRLTVLLADRALTAHWQRYRSDAGVDDRDREYARRLREYARH